MAKNVFRSNEVSVVDGKVYISPPEQFVREPEPLEVEEVEEEEYTGPTADDLRREAEEFKRSWEQEKQEMIDAAKAEADQIIKDAEKVAFDEVKKKNDQAQQTKQEAEHEAERIRNEAENEAERVVNEAESKSRKIEEEARDRGFAQGREDGYAKGEQEVERLVDRMHVILNKTIDRRNEIIEESEAQLVQLVLQIAKKVVKVISENQKNIVINNVVQSLRKLRAKADVVIRVNVQDLKLTTDHVKRFMEIAEKAEHITVMEDSTVDRGGCIIETDFGQIDARISSQLREIEEKILELVPIKTKARPKDSS